MSTYHRNNPDSGECQQMTRDNERAVFAAKMDTKAMEHLMHPKPVRFHIIEKLDELKSCQWWLYRVTAEMSDGTEREGTVQGAHEYAGEFAAETWEPDE